MSGVAPLAVFFDATGTTATSTPRPFHDLEYRWDFGDPAGGAAWSAGSRPGVSSRNAATGPVAAHVFETPGTYTVTLTAGGEKASRIISVQDPEEIFSGAKTTCFSTSGNFAGCPAGANRVTTSDFATVAATANSVRRLLLRRGETWSVATFTTIKAPGPGILGAFGSGPSPRIQATASNVAMVGLSSPTTPTMSDWRVMDLELDGSPMGNGTCNYSTRPPGGNCTRGVSGNGGISQVTLLRLTIHDMNVGIILSANTLDAHKAGGAAGHALWDQFAVVESSMRHAIGGYGAFIAAERFSFLGNVVDDTSTGHHGMRNPYLGKGVISNNSFSNAAPGVQVLTVRAPPFAGTPTIPAGTYTRFVVVSDNKFVGGDNDQTVTSTPQNATSDERIRDEIFERNWFVAGRGTQAALVITASEITIRNNICDTSGGRAHNCFFVGKRGPGSPEPPPSQIRVYNNTCYSADAGTFNCAGFDASVTNVAVHNNLASAPRATNPRMILDQGVAGLVHSNNSADTQILGVAPGWVSATPKAPQDFRLAPGSPYIDAGLAIPVFSDFFRVNRPQGAKPAVGAAEKVK